MSKKDELLARCKELGIPTESLTNNTERQAAIDKREAELEAEKAEAEKAAAEKAEAEKAAAEKAEAENAEAEKAAAEKAEAEKAEAEKAAAEKEQEAKRLVHEDKRGRKWGFKESAPKTLNIDGHPMSQEEIFDNVDVISELVYGNSSFLIQIHE